LGDYERKLCFQVTSTSLKNHRTKIQETINLFIGEKQYQYFDHLKFLFLGDKQQKYQKGFNTQNLFTFDPKKMGEIIPDQNITRFKLPNAPDLFNTFKQNVIDTINSILEQHNIRPIDGVS